MKDKKKLRFIISSAVIILLLVLVAFIISNYNTNDQYCLIDYDCKSVPVCCGEIQCANKYNDQMIQCTQECYNDPFEYELPVLCGCRSFQCVIEE